MPPRAEGIFGRRRSTVVRAIQEITFIVAGVLIALAANSWWEHRDERDRERLNLRLLHDATEENLRRVSTAIAFDSISMASAERALQAVRAAGVLPMPDSMDDWLYRAAWSSNFHPLTGAYIALANNAELNLIRNDELRAVIVEMAGEIAGVEQEIRTFDAVATTNAQRLFQYFDVIRAEARTDSTWFVAGDRLLEGGARVDWVALQSSPSFDLALFMVWTNAGNRLDLFRRLRVPLEGLRSRLAAELVR
jgi:hypothetical protein